jgi:hypothetical protein
MMKFPIYELKIDESEDDNAEVSFVALVDAPAIKKDFIAFNNEFVQPGQGEKENEFMPRCIKYMIDEGKEQEQAIAICSSVWEEHFAESYTDYPEAAKEAAQKETNLAAFAIQNEDRRIITGPLMVPEQLIYRSNSRFGEHYVKFSAETIQQIAIKFHKKGFQKNVNLMHDADLQVDGVTMFESFITDPSRGINAPKSFSDLPAGTWFGSFAVENEDVWKMIKEGKVKGFSVEGMFEYDDPKKDNAEEALSELKRILAIIQ